MTDKDGDPLLETAPFIGHDSEAPVGYNTRDLLLYAVSIGCAKESRTGHDSNHSDLRFIYEQDTKFAAFPTFPITLAMKGSTQDVDANASSNMYLGKNPKPKRDHSKPPAPRLKVKGVITGVDAERYIERVHDVPATNVPPMKIRGRTIGISKKGKNMLTESESELIGEDGTVYTKFQGGGMSIGAYGFKNSGRSNSEKITPPSREADEVVELETTPEQAHIYRLAGDYNPLHIDPQFPGVKGAGFPAPILHGLCTLGHGARAVLLGMGGNDPKRFHALKLRFASPVIPGDVLVTKMWKISSDEASKFVEPLPAGAERIIFTTEVKSSGKVVLGNAYMDLFTAPQDKSAPTKSRL
jgi:acyl dehydratase